MSEFRFILDGQTLRDHPDGWQDFTERLVRDDEVHGITYEYETNLTFYGDGYVILNNKFLSGTCSETTLIVEQRCGGGGYDQILELIIKSTDLDTNLQKCYCEAKSTDSNYYGMIHNNREVAVPLQATLSKNGIDIDACPSSEFKVFLPRLNASDDVDYLTTTRTGYDHKDALSFALRYITDGQISEVQSTYLDNLTFEPNPAYFDVDASYGDGQTMGFFILSGYTLRKGGDEPVAITFKRLVDTLFNKHALYWQIIDGVFIIEPIEYFFEYIEEDNQDYKRFISQPDIIRSTDTRRFYSAVEVGSIKDLPDRDLRWSMPYVELIAHARQRYSLQGVCNTDTVLQLVDGYVYDSNVIEKVIVTEQDAVDIQDKDQTEDDTVFYIQYFKHDGGENADDLYYSAFDTKFLRPDPPAKPVGLNYNPYLYNQLIVDRHKVQSNYAYYIADSDDNFEAEKENDPFQGDAYVEDFQDTTYFYGDTLPGDPIWAGVGELIGLSGLSTQFQQQFGWPGFPAAFYWGGLINNSANACNNFGFACSVNPIRIPFQNDSTDGNFDPNDNWDVTDAFFTAPSTGVYTLETNLLVNKVMDTMQVGGDSGPYINTNEVVPANSKILRGGFNFVEVFFVIYDSSDNYITHVLAYGQNPVTGEYTAPQASVSWYPGQGHRVADVINFPSNTSPNLLNAATYTYWDYGQNLFNSWPQAKPVDRVGTLYLESGQKVGLMVNFISSSHFRHPSFVRRRVRYGVVEGSKIKTTFITTGGGEFTSVNPDLHYANLYQFNRPITAKDWKEIKEGARNPLFISPTESGQIRAFPNTITRNFNSGATEFELIGNRNQPYF